MPQPERVSPDSLVVHRGLDAARAHRPATARRAVCVGQFDGVHVGHQALLGELLQVADKAGAEPAVVTFHPHPLAVLRGSRPPRVLTLMHRLVALSRAGIRVALVLPFTREVATLEADEFVADVLVGALGARQLLMGFDSAWGRARRGTFEYLEARGAALGVEVRQASALHLGGERVSSSAVREAIRQGDLARLRTLLGRPHSVLGRVVRGDGRGRELGFPTANLDCQGEETSPPGVYFATVSLWGDLPDVFRDGSCRIPREPRTAGLPAIVNVGARPTFAAAGARTSVEVHLLDFDGDLYGQHVEVHFLQRRRDERRFASAAELVRQIDADVDALRVFFAARDAE